MPEEEFTQVPVKFIEDLSQKIEHLQHSLRRKQRILNKVSFLATLVALHFTLVSKSVSESVSEWVSQWVVVSN